MLHSKMPSADPNTPGEREKELGRRLRQARVEAELDLNQAARASAVSAVSIQKYETAKRTPTVHRMAALAKLYGVSMDWLVGLSSARDPFPPGLVIEDCRVVESILGARNEAEILPLLNWRPSLYLALIEVPGKFRLLGAQDAMEMAVKVREHLRNVAPGLVQRYEKFLDRWGIMRTEIPRGEEKACDAEPEKATEAQ